MIVPFGCSAGRRAAGDKTDAATFDEIGDTRCDDGRLCNDRWQRPGSLHSLRSQFSVLFMSIREVFSVVRLLSYLRTICDQL